MSAAIANLVRKRTKQWDRSCIKADAPVLRPDEPVPAPIDPARLSRPWKSSMVAVRLRSTACLAGLPCFRSLKAFWTAISSSGFKAAQFG